MATSRLERLANQPFLYDVLIETLYEENNREVCELMKENKQYFVSYFDMLPELTPYRGLPYSMKDELVLAYLNREQTTFVDYLVKQKPKYKPDKPTLDCLKLNYSIAMRPEDPTLPEYVKVKNRKIRFIYSYFKSKNWIL